MVFNLENSLGDFFQKMPPVKIKKGIYWVGAIDWNIRDFHGYSTPRGSTYNAYLVIDEKIILFDTVKRPFISDLLHNIRRLINPEKIDYLVVNHVEMDHSGSLPEIIERVRPEKIFCSKTGEKALKAHFHFKDWPIEVVSTEDKISLGQHYATSKLFDDEVDFGELMQEATKYYANIVLPFSPQVEKLLKIIEDLKLEIKIILPDHGVIWRQYIPEIMEAYKRWSSYHAEERAVVVYATMWKRTEKMALAITEDLAQAGVAVKVMNAEVCHRSDIMTEVMLAKGLAFGSSTLNNHILPVMADVLTYITGLRLDKGSMWLFGSYGWSGEAVKHITNFLEGMKVEVVAPELKVQ